MTTSDTRHCMNLVRQHDYSRYIATLYLPKPQRDAAFAIYGFDVEVSKIGRLVSEPMAGEIRLQWWRDIVSGKGEGKGNPVAMALSHVIARHDLPVAKFHNLLEARIFDLYADPMPDKNTFEGYLGETCAAMFQFILLAGKSNKFDASHNDTIAQACGHSGVFYGTVNLLGFLPEHKFRGKKFFPTELANFSLVDDSIASSATNPVSQQWLKEVCSFAVGHYEKCVRAINQLPPEYRTVFLPLAGQMARLNFISKYGIELSRQNKKVSRVKIWWTIRNAAKHGKF